MKYNLKLTVGNPLKENIHNSTLSMDVSGLIEDFDYKPDTSLEDGIGKLVKWYRKFYGENK